jgi:hypothetical protein
MENKKINEFEIDKLVVSIFNKIAQWNNKDYLNNIEKSNELKQLSFDVISEVSKAAFEHLGIPYNGEIEMDKESRAKVIEFKEKIFQEKKEELKEEVKEKVIEKGKEES